MTRLRADGGLDPSTVLMQACADILQIPVDFCTGWHATALGAAALARLQPEPDRSVCATSSPTGHRRPATNPAGLPARASEFRSAWRDLAATTYPQETS